MVSWWLSFCDPSRPPGAQFLGVAIVDATHFTEALKVTWILKCNPGGEVEGFPLPAWAKVPAEWKERLLTKEECKRLEKLLAPLNPERPGEGEGLS